MSTTERLLRVIYCRTHNCRICLYIAYIACGSNSLYIETLYFFLTVLALSAGNIKIRYDAKTSQFSIFWTRHICVLQYWFSGWVGYNAPTTIYTRCQVGLMILSNYRWQHSSWVAVTKVRSSVSPLRINSELNLEWNQLRIDPWD